MIRSIDDIHSISDLKGLVNSPHFGFPQEGSSNYIVGCNNLDPMFSPSKLLNNNYLWKYLVITMILLINLTVVVIFVYDCWKSSTFSQAKLPQYSWNYIGDDKVVVINSPTNINHIIFGISGSSNTWGQRKPYIEAWWRPNITRGYLFLDYPPQQHHLPWPPSSPPFRISENNSKYSKYDAHRTRSAIRMARVIEETFKATADQRKKEVIRWYVIADDDTLVFIDNLVEMLSKYDHEKYFYIGINSECVRCNAINSFEMAFGGAGFALSYPLAKAVASNMDLCIKRYPFVHGSDHILQACIADLGVSLTREKGFHQIDFRGDISGFLSAHPSTPLISLHHLDAVDPFFPSMDRHDSIKYFMKAAKIDHSRLLQQSVCNLNRKNWTFSVSWGYTVQVYEETTPPSVVHKPIATFKEWQKGGRSTPFMLNARFLPDDNDSCKAPHVLYYDGVEQASRDNYIVTSYTKALPLCSSAGNNHSAESISKIYVLSPKEMFVGGDRNKRECCDVEQMVGMDSLVIIIRGCLDEEIIA